MRHGTCSYIYVYINVIANSVMLQLYVLYIFNIIFKIKQIVYSLRVGPFPPLNEKLWVRTCIYRLIRDRPNPVNSADNYFHNIFNFSSDRLKVLKVASFRDIFLSKFFMHSSFFFPVLVTCTAYYSFNYLYNNGQKR